MRVRSSTSRRSGLRPGRVQTRPLAAMYQAYGELRGAFGWSFIVLGVGTLGVLLLARFLTWPVWAEIGALTSIWLGGTLHALRAVGKRPPYVSAGASSPDNQSASEAGEMPRAAPPTEATVSPHRDRLATLGELVCGIAHELNNPLAAVCGLADLLHDQSDLDPRSRQRVEALHTQAERCRRLVENLLRFARLQPPRRERLDLDQVVETSLTLMAGPLRAAGVSVVRDLAGVLPPVWADEFELQQVVVNILTNACQALASRGTGLVRVQTGLSPRGGVLVRITDNGPGMTRDVARRIFDPFFTTKGGEGTGLGLSLSRAIVTRHGGRLWADGSPGQGATFQIELPIGVPVRSEGAGGTESPTSPLSVLVVDDEPVIVDLLAQLLVAEGHRVSTCAGGAEALEQLEDGPIDVILSDLCMPDMGGEELHAAVRERWPELAGRMAFVTGDLLNPDLVGLSEETGCPLIGKPFQRAEIRRVLAELAARTGGASLAVRGR